jgi:hypothetical protein
VERKHKNRHRLQSYVVLLLFSYTPCIPYHIVNHPSINLADSTGNDSAASPPAGAVDSARTEATLGEPRPDRASVRTTGKSTVGIEDGVASLNEVRVARLAVMEVSVLLDSQVENLRMLTGPWHR